MPELDDADKTILAKLLRETIERDRFPLSPQVKWLKAVLAKLNPPAPRPEPLPPPKPPGERSRAMAARQDRRPISGDGGRSDQGTALKPVAEWS